MNIRTPIAVAAATVLATIFAGPPAHAASSDCDANRMCLWDDHSFNDTMKSFVASQSDLNDIGFGDKTSSAYNKTSVAWVLWGNHDYTGDGLCMKATASIANMDDFGFGDKTSSIHRRGDNTCPGGVTVVGPGPHKSIPW